jgi:tetratricopeptide (TPR) repeat protein
MMLKEEDYLIQGKCFQQKQEWAEAINAYKKALELNPESKAKFALEYIYDILNYRYTDLLNP